MAVSVSVSGHSTSQKKVIWSWSVSEKSNKFGSAQTESVIIGTLIGLHSALSAIPEHFDIIFRTSSKSIAEIINDPEKITKNPVVLNIFHLIKNRSGRVNAVVVTQATLTENDKRAMKMARTVGGGSNSSAPRRPQPNSILTPSSKSTKVKVSVTSRSAKSTPVRTKRPKEVLITGLEDDYDTTPLPPKTQPTVGKPVTCESCDGPINPLTYECRCSN